MPNYTIANGCNVSLNLQQGTIPNMGDSLKDWLQWMTFTRVTKTTEGFRLVETSEDISFWGIVQPLKERELQLKPEGQRAWSWIKVIAQCEPLGAVITLNVDEVVSWLGIQTRVMARLDYALYSYVEYHLAQDWTGQGPPTP